MIKIKIISIKHIWLAWRTTNSQNDTNIWISPIPILKKEKKTLKTGNLTSTTFSNKSEKDLLPKFTEAWMAKPENKLPSRCSIFDRSKNQQVPKSRRSGNASFRKSQNWWWKLTVQTSSNVLSASKTRISKSWWFSFATRVHWWTKSNCQKKSLKTRPFQCLNKYLKA